MAQHISYPSIEQFRNVIRSVKDRCTYHGIPLPELEFTGTVKLHGTNAAVVIDTDNGELWAQSRTNVITPESDNAGFAAFVQAKAAAIRGLVNSARIVYGLENFQPGDHLAIYGEWCGQSIQKGVAITGLPKMFVVFGIRVKRTEEDSYWFAPHQIRDVFDGYGSETAKNDQIFCIHKFKTYKIHIDFAKPEYASVKLSELTLEVENECPVGKHFGVFGVGEGIVWTANPTTHVPFRVSDLVFKVKGEKHSETKVKTLAPVDVEKIENIRALVEALVTEHRLEKKLDEMENVAKVEATLQNTPVFLKTVGQDVHKEEADTIAASGLPEKEVMSAISKHARQWYLEQVNKRLDG